MLSNSIESAQARVESRNFGIRKNILEYDDVMNKQRELIYEQRNQVLDGADIKDKVRSMIRDTIGEAVATYLTDEIVHDNWDLDGLRNYLMGWLVDETDLHFSTEELGNTSIEEVTDSLVNRAFQSLDEREEEYGSELMREVERVMLLRTVDEHWMEHIDAMDELRQGIGLRAYGQRNPVIDYRNEGSDMFDSMIESVRRETAKRVITARVKRQEEVKREKVAEESGTSGDGTVDRTVRGKGVVSKNAPCPCGSGKKYKRCCGKNLDD